MSESTKLRTTILLEKELYNQIKALAEQDSRSVNSMMVKLLKSAIQAQGGGN